MVDAVVYSFAAIGLLAVIRWLYRTRNYGSSIGQLLKPRGYGSLNGH